MPGDYEPGNNKKKLDLKNVPSPDEFLLINIEGAKHNGVETLLALARGYQREGNVDRFNQLMEIIKGIKNAGGDELITAEEYLTTLESQKLIPSDLLGKLKKYQGRE